MCTFIHVFQGQSVIHPLWFAFKQLIGNLEFPILDATYIRNKWVRSINIKPVRTVVLYSSRHKKAKTKTNKVPCNVNVGP